MTALGKMGLLWRTARHLKPIQIANRLQRKLLKPRLPSAHALTPRKGGIKQDAFLENHASLFPNHHFSFLNDAKTLTFPSGWNEPSRPILWLYNLHYFDGLQCPSTDGNLKAQLVDQWIGDNPPAHGIGWQPYPLSLRTINWIKWFMREQKPSGLWLSSLCQQVRYLDKTLEFHLLGNHLLENAKALVFAGVYFEGPEAEGWLERGLHILDRELDEQILADGGHFELSTMYQGIMLELVLDILALAKDVNAAKALSDRISAYEETARRMADWLFAMLHPDGDISFFNDAAIGIAHQPALLFVQAEKLANWHSPTLAPAHWLKNSGYARLQNKVATLFMDLAEIGPAYLPGHGHADALSIEVSLFGQRLFVNCGISEYGIGPRREYERSTAAHSTLELAGQNSSETWAGFRVGRRAHIVSKAVSENDGQLFVSGTHNGYRFLKGRPRHCREVHMNDNQIAFHDMVSGGKYEALVRYHLHPDVRVTVDENGKNGVFIMKNGHDIHWKAEADFISLEPFEYAPSFGARVPSQTLILHTTADINTRLELRWEAL